MHDILIVYNAYINFKSLKQMYINRVKNYEKSHITIDVNDISISGIIFI